MGKVVGEPYWGKPNIRFDEGAKGKKSRLGLRHRRMAKAAGNGYSPSPKATAPRFYSTKSGSWKGMMIQLVIDKSVILL
jgi:hypothetical protein